VEGLLSPAPISQEFHDAFKILQYVTRWNSYRSISLICQPFVARLVVNGSLASSVSLSVYFYRQPRFEAGEVEDIWIGGMLAPEFETAGPLSKLSPEENFGERHFPSQTSCLADRRAGAGQHGNFVGRASLSTALRAVPLPVPGRIFRSTPIITS
jgi:hypothetical protein